MALNGSEFIDSPFNVSFSPYTDMFAQIFGNGNVFFIFPIIVLTFVLYVKTDNPVVASMFMMGASGIFSFGTFLARLPELSIMFTIFTAIGLTAAVASIIFQKRGY